MKFSIACVFLPKYREERINLLLILFFFKVINLYIAFRNDLGVFIYFLYSFIHSEEVYSNSLRFLQ